MTTTVQDHWQRLRPAIPRIARWVGLGLAALLGLVVLLLFGLQLPGVQRAILTSTLNDTLAPYAMEARADGVAGFWPWHVKIDQLAFSDANGAFATLEDTEIDLRPLALLNGQVHITRAAIASGTYLRQPVLPERAPEPFRLPTLPDQIGLPIAILIDDLSIGPVVSTASDLEIVIEGGGTLALSNRALAGELAFSGGNAGDAHLRFALDPAARRADLAFLVNDPNGQWLVPLTPLAPGTALHADVTLTGPANALVLEGIAQWGDARLDLNGAGAWDNNLFGTVEARLQSVFGQETAAYAGTRQNMTAAVRLRRNGAIEIETLTLQSETFAAQISGRIGNTLDLSGVIALNDGAAWAPRLGLDALDGAALTFGIAGQRAAPELTFQGTAENIGAAQVASTRIDFGGTGLVSRNGRVVDAVLRVVSEPLRGEQLPEGLNHAAAGLHATVQLDLEEKAAAISDLEGTWGWLTATGSGTIDSDSPMRFHAALRVDDLSQVSADLTGRAALTIEARRTRGSPTLSLTGTGSTDALTTQGRWAQILGDAPQSEFDLAITDQRFEISRLNVSAAAGTAHLTGSVNREDRSAALQGSYAINDVAALVPQLTGALSGDITFVGTGERPTIEMTSNAPQLGVGSASLRELVLTGRLTSGRGQVALRARAGTEPVSLTFPFTQEGSNIAGTLAAQFASLHVDGPVSWVDNSAVAELAIAADDIAPFAQFVRQIGGASDDLRVQGALAGTATVNGQLGHVEATLTAPALAGLETPFRASEIAASASVDVATRLVEAAQLTISGAQLGPSRFRSIDVAASGPFDGLEARLALRGPTDEPFSLDVSAVRHERGAGSDIQVTALQGRSLDFVVELDEPAHMRLGADGIELSRATMSVVNEATGRRGSLSAEAQLWAGAPFVHLEAENLPAGALAVFGLPVDWTGILAGVVTLNAREGNNPLRVALTATDLTNDPDIPPLDVALDANATGTELQGHLRIDDRASGAVLVNALATVPLRWATGDLAPAVNWDAPLAGDIHIDAPLDRLWLFVPVDTVDVSGYLTSDIALGGSLGNPQASGAATLQGGTLEHYQTGFLLSDANGTLELTDGGDVLIALQAGDGNGGTARLDGTAHLPRDEDWAIDGRLRLSNLAVARRDELRAHASGDLRLTGSLDEAILQGTVTMDRIDAQIPNQLPPSVVDLPVTRIDANGEIVPDPKGNGDRRQLDLPLTLDVTVEVPRQAFVRGRGLDSEWGGTLAISGTMEAPRVRGALDIQRGTFDFSRTRFTLAEGRIEFKGGDRIDPSINLRAEADGPQFTSIVRATGRARAPTITITSDPVMPEETVMAQILFGKRPDELTALELVQIAEASATLTGRGGGGVLSGARRALGLDFLSVDTGTTASGNRDVNVSVGQYVAPNIFVGTRRGTEAGSGAVTVEMEVTPNITVDAEVRQDSQGSAGVDWRWDY